MSCSGPSKRAITRWHRKSPRPLADALLLTEEVRRCSPRPFSLFGGDNNADAAQTTNDKNKKKKAKKDTKAGAISESSSSPEDGPKRRNPQARAQTADD